MRMKHAFMAVVGLMILTTFIAAPAHAKPKPPPISHQEVVIDQFTNPGGGPVLYRQGWHAGGSTGFGYDKIVHKHGITNNEIIRAVVQFPHTTRQEGVTRWVHEKEALLIGLTGVNQSLMVRVVIEYGTWAGPGQMGVVTAYCVGIPGQCPTGSTGPSG
jgi:hypothetical protein